MIPLGEDVSGNAARSEDNSGSRSMSLEESPHPSNPPETTAGVQDPGPDHQIGSSDSLTNDDNIPPIEALRDPIHDDYLHMAPPILSDMEEPDRVLEEQLLKEKNNSSPTLGEILVPDGHLSSFKQTPPLDLAHPESAQYNSDPHVSFGLSSPVMAIQSSPPVEPTPAAEQPMTKRRRIKYDGATVLTNEFMKKSLDDPSNLSRKRKGVCSFLNVWKLNNTHKKQKVLFDPIITGLCDNLCQHFENDYISEKPLMFDTEQVHSDDLEIEHLHDFVGPSANNMIPTFSPDDMMHIPSPDNRSFSSPRPMDEYTPAISTNVGSKSCQVQTTLGTGVRPTPYPTSSTRSFLSDAETPMPFSEGQQGFEDSGGLSDIPEVNDAGELTFLEDDDGTPMRMRGTPETDYSSGKQRPPPEIGSLLARTRALARYIKEKSLVTPSTLKDVGSLSLNSILEGKRRKLCSQMFFEILVLKSCDLVDVKQDEPYGYITLKVTSKLSKQQFSS